jgi:hypothetical protein
MDFRPLPPQRRQGIGRIHCRGVVTTSRMERREVLEVRFRSGGGRDLPRPERLLSDSAEHAAGYEVAMKVEVVTVA